MTLRISSNSSTLGVRHELVERAAGVVDEDVEPAEALDRQGDGVVRDALVGRIADYGRDVVGLEVADGVGAVGDDHARAALAQELGGGSADAAGGAGDDGDAAGEIEAEGVDMGGSSGRGELMPRPCQARGGDPVPIESRPCPILPTSNGFGASHLPERGTLMPRWT